MPGALLSGQTSSRSAAQHDDVGLLAGRQRADLAVEVGAAGALDGGEFEHVAAGEQRRQVLLALAHALQDMQALQVEGRPHEPEHVLRHRRAVVGAQTRPHAVVERLLDRGHAVGHRHFERRRERDAAAAVLDQSPGLVVEVRAVDVFVARPQQPGAPERQQRLGIDPDMQDGPHADLARVSEDLSVEARRHGEREQLVLRAEIGPPQPHDVLRILSARPHARANRRRPPGCRTPAARECRRRCAPACARPAKCRRSRSCPCRSCRAPSPARRHRRRPA